MPKREGCRLGGLVIALVTVVSVACGSSGGSPPAPTPQPSPVPAPAPGPVPNGDLTGTWSGPATDSSGGGSMSWQLTQSGASFSGAVSIEDTKSGLSAFGTVTGTVSGSAIRYSISIPAGGFETLPSCSASVTGDGQVGSSTITGTYSGSNSCSGSVSSGQFTLNKQ